LWSLFAKVQSTLTAGVHVHICRAEPLKHARSANKRKAILGLEKGVDCSLQCAG
jgi:hypothetical protein